VAVVAGGSSGIGLAIVRELLASGWHVGFFSHQRDRVEAACSSLAKDFPAERIFGRSADLRDATAVREFFSEISRRWLPPAALICNAGFSPKRAGGRIPLADIDIAEWNDVLAVNLTGALLCCQCALPAMVEARHGRIVLIGSVAGRTMPRIASASYVASKSALVGLARSIVGEYSAFGVTANTVCPGRILTEMTGDADTPTNRAALQRIPIGRLGHPDDVARLVEFLVRREADFLNGAVIDVNGGEFTPP
jgi:3-oxoacyl-[acyl-carrier protein] reductase